MTPKTPTVEEGEKVDHPHHPGVAVTDSYEVSGGDAERVVVEDVTGTLVTISVDMIGTSGPERITDLSTLTGSRTAAFGDEIRVEWWHHPDAAAPRSTTMRLNNVEENDGHVFASDANGTRVVQHQNGTINLEERDAHWRWDVKATNVKVERLEPDAEARRRYEAESDRA